MTKGCCKKSKVEVEEPEKIEGFPENVEEEIAQEPKTSIKPQLSIRDFIHNRNLVEYQQIIANDPHNKSLTKEVFTKEMAKDYEFIRGHENEGLGQCIFPNVYNTNCLIPYVSGPDCYNIFAEFFGEIIERIHGLPDKEVSLHPYFGNLKRHALIDLNSYTRRRQRVIYSEMMTRRNLQDIHFTPYINQSDRRNVISQIEPKIRAVCENLVEIPTIPLEWEQRMNSVTNELDDSGSMLDYPEDRLMLVFKDDDNFYQGAIINFDDHVEFIESANNGKIGELFLRMYNFVHHDQFKEINYAAHTVFGHLTLSPAHIGTGFSIRVLAKFPFISRMADANSLVKPFDCAISNELEDQNNGMIILYTIKSLNKTEAEIFEDLLLAYNKISLMEDELELTSPMSIQQDCAIAENLEILMNIIQENESKSYTKKFLTRNLVQQYDGVKTNFGTLLNNCIRHNAYHPHSLFPRACDSDSYTVFQSFFNPILLETNSVGSFKHPKASNYGSTENKLFQLRHPSILSYRVSFTRNINAFPFPIMMSTKDRMEMEEMMIDLIDEFPVEMEGHYVPLKSLKSSVYFEEIIKHKFIPSINEVNKSCGLYSDWPRYRGIFFAQKNINYPNIYLAILVNFIDHIKVIALDPSGKKLNLCYDRAVNVMKFLNLRLQEKYAYRWGYGYLTTVPSSVGCGMRISALVKLVHLGKNREILEKECKTMQFAYRGTSGYGSVAVNNIFDLSLKLNLNVTEIWLLMMFAQRLKDLILIERQYDPRIEIPTNQSPEFKEIYEEDEFTEEEPSGEVEEVENEPPASVQSDNNVKASINGEEPVNEKPTEKEI